MKWVVLALVFPLTICNACAGDEARPARSAPGTPRLSGTTMRPAFSKKLSYALQLMSLLLCVLLCVDIARAEGDYQNKNQLASVEKIKVHMEDSAKDGCLPQPKVLQTEAELILRRSNIAVVNEPDEIAGFHLSISVIGYAILSGRSCVVGLRISLWRIGLLRDNNVALVTAYEKEYIMSSSKGEMQDYLRSQTSEIVSDLANEILKVRTQ